MSTNGNMNGQSTNGIQEVTQWKVGLMNDAKKYLTAETFGFKLNVSAAFLKKKQTWILEEAKEENTYYIKSHLGRYLSADKYGEVKCELESEEREACCVFVVEFKNDGTGRWAFRNRVHDNYLGGTDDNVKCFSKNITDSELWTVHLATHPQVNIRNIIRKRYAVMCEDEIHCKENVPWGEAGLLILHFWKSPDKAAGKYSLLTCDGRALQRDGTLGPNDGSPDTLFTMEIRSCAAITGTGLAFRDCNGYYISALGSTATMKSGKNKTAAVGKDELFSLECSHPQVTVTSMNAKHISAKQGVDLSANQSEVCEKSTFQMEYDKHNQKWSFRTCVDNKYWSLESFGGIQAACMSVVPKSMFSLVSNSDGTVCIKASNGNCLYNKQTGSILCNMENPDTKNFVIRMVNRPFLILKCDHGFVALKSDTSDELVGNKAAYEPTFIHPQEDGYYYLQAKNNKYWTVGDDKIIRANGETPSCKFLLEFQDLSMMTIKAPNGYYLKGEPNSFLAKGEEVDGTTLWEY